MLRFTFIFAGIVLFTACGTASSLLTDDRRESYVRKNDLSETDSVHVMEGRIYRGMSIDHVLALYRYSTRRWPSAVAVVS